MVKPSEKRLAKGLWWDRNWPVLEGCSRCSPACDNCFAAEYAHRFEGSLPYLRGLTTAEGKWTGSVIMRHDQLGLPLKTTKPTVWFVAERSDLFHPSVPGEYLDRVFAVMARAPQHTFMVLTKRPERMRLYLSGLQGQNSPWPVPNLWLGVTAENQEQADKRIPILLQTPAVHRFVSIEPILGPIDFRFHLGLAKNHDDLRGELHWVICGGESGRNARPAHPDWVRSLRDQCAAAAVPFFFKQWGEWVVKFHDPFISEAGGNVIPNVAWPDGSISWGSAAEHGGDGWQLCCVGKAAAGRLLDGKEHLELPKVSEGTDNGNKKKTGGSCQWGV